MNSVDFIGQFADMLKTHSIVVNDRSTLLKLFENVIDLCTKTPKTKLKAAIKAETDADAEPKKTAPKKKMPVKPAAAEKLVGEMDAGDCPMVSDMPINTPARGRGRPRKEVSADENVAAAVDGEKKKRGRPKKEKSLVMSSNDDEDALIAQMLNQMQSSEPSPQSSSVSPILVAASAPLEPIEVEQDVVTDTTDATTDDEQPPAPKTTKAKAAKEPKAKAAKEPKTKAVKEPKTKAAKEPKTKAVKEPKTKAAKEPKAKAVKEPKAKAAKEPNAPNAVAAEADRIITQSLAKLAVAYPDVAKDINVTASACSAAPVRETKAGSDGKFYLMHNFPRSSFTFNGRTYLRTETDNVYDNLTLELIGVWDHLNHEIITPNDDDVEDLDALWSDEE